jgi:hypothetical protein
MSRAVIFGLILTTSTALTAQTDRAVQDNSSNLQGQVDDLTMLVHQLENRINQLEGKTTTAQPVVSAATPESAAALQKAAAELQAASADTPRLTERDCVRADWCRFQNYLS